jgi:hypothetical protein
MGSGCHGRWMERPDALVIDDQRTFRFPAIYARTVAEGMSLLSGRAWRELWLDYNLGPGLTIEPVLQILEERAARGSPFPIGLICVHTSGPAEGNAMVAALAPWYRVRRVVAHSFRPVS